MDAKDEVKRRLSVEEVIADYLELKRAGRNFKGISPFTAEKQPVLWLAQKNKYGTTFLQTKVVTFLVSSWKLKELIFVNR